MIFFTLTFFLQRGQTIFTHFGIYYINMKYDCPEALPISRNEFSQIYLFRNIQFEKLAGFLLGCSVINYNKDETIINPTTSTKAVYILINGLLQVNVESEKGGTFSLTIKPGQCVGEMSVLDDVAPCATIIAKEKSKILYIPSDIALSMIRVSHELCLNFLLMLSQRLRTNNMMVCDEQYHIRCIEENARIDPLTGLHNRRWLEDMYTREMQRSNIGNYKLTAFMLDIDHFKKINDTYGHMAGDQVLISIAQTLLHSLRPSDMPVRYGGEEFTIFLPGTTDDNARIIAERIRRNMENMTFSLPNGTILQITVSIGYAERIENDTVNSLIERADKAMYYAKENGRNRICKNCNDGKFELII